MTTVSATVPLSQPQAVGQWDRHVSVRDTWWDRKRDTACKAAQNCSLARDSPRDSVRDSNEKECPTAGELVEVRGTVSGGAK